MCGKTLEIEGVHLEGSLQLKHRLQTVVSFGWMELSSLAKNTADTCLFKISSNTPCHIASLTTLYGPKGLKILVTQWKSLDVVQPSLPLGCTLYCQYTR